MAFLIYTIMITKFKLFETITNNGMSEPQLDKLTDGLSLNLYKGRKRNDKKSINYKPIKIKDLESKFNDRKINGENVVITSIINVKLSNKDDISGEYKRIENKGELIENNIKIEINNEVIYHLDNEKFNNDELINKMVTLYKKYISKKWKIK